MIKVIIIDDEPLARSIVKEYLKEFPQLQLMQECGDGFEGLKAITEHIPDLVFLDVQMPKINGFELLELVDQPLSVIFTTAFDAFALKAFETNAIDYLLKPFSQERFNAAIKKWEQQYQGGLKKNDFLPLLNATSNHPDQHSRIVVKSGNKIMIVPAEKIHYLEANDDYVKIYTADGSFLKKQTMQHFENVLDKNRFMRVHRSYIIQLAEMTRIEPYEKENYLAILKTGARIPVSKNGYAKLKTTLGI